MPYLIDGHNLIGCFPGVSLSDPDDEEKLLKMLWIYARRTRRRIVVFFDQGDRYSRPPAGGMVEARFIPPPRTADDAILDLLRLRKDARHFTVVTTDSEVRAQARRLGAKVILSEQFSREAQAVLLTAEKEKPPGNPEEIDDWLRLFNHQ